MCFVAINLKGWLFLCRKAFSYCLPPLTVMSFFFYREKNISILLLSSIFYTFSLFLCGFFLFPSHRIICPGLPIQIRILLGPQSFLSPPREVPLVTRWMKWNAHVSEINLINTGMLAMASACFLQYNLFHSVCILMVCLLGRTVAHRAEAFCAL